MLASSESKSIIIAIITQKTSSSQIFMTYWIALMTRKGWRTMTRTRRRMRSVTARGHYPCCRASRGRRRMRGSFTRRRQVLLIVLRRCQHHLQHHFFWKFLFQIVVYNYDIAGIFLFYLYVKLSLCIFFFSFLKNCLSHFFLLICTNRSVLCSCHHVVWDHAVWDWSGHFLFYLFVSVIMSFFLLLKNCSRLIWSEFWF